MNIKNNFTGLSLLNISADQRIGIATNDPVASLHINTAAADTYQVLIGNSNGLGLGCDLGGQQRLIIGSAYGNAATKMSFTLGGFTTASDKMTIYGTGNIGINTTTDAGYKLDVSGSGRFTSNLTVTGSVIIDGGLFDTLSTGSLATGSTLIYSVNTGSYAAGFFDYYAISGSNGRSGTIMSFWLGGQVQYNDNSTPDVGNTNNIAFSMSLAGANAQLFASASSAGWNVKTTFRTI